MADDNSQPALDSEGYRAWLRRLFGDRADEIARRLDQVMNAERRVRRPFTCRGCGLTERKDISIRDDRLLLDFLKWLGEAGFGRPPADSAEGGGDFIFVNKIILVDADGEETLSWLSERGLLGKPLSEVEEAWAVEHTTPPEAAARLREIEAGE